MMGTHPPRRGRYPVAALHTTIAAAKPHPAFARRTQVRDASSSRNSNFVSAGAPFRGANRRGVSLLIVMVAISSSLVLTMAFLRTQTAALQWSQNGQRRELALQAAQTGAAVALNALQSPQWPGVSQQLSGHVHSDAWGDSTYQVQFVPLPAENGYAPGADAALYVLVRSTGVWQSSADQNERAERRVEVVTRLEPRVPGRPIGPLDSPDVHDLAANPGDYDAIQSYALYAGGSGNSLRLAPRSRVDGAMWVRSQFHLYPAVNWPSYARDEYYNDLGVRFVTTDSQTGFKLFHDPHPAGGHMTFGAQPDSTTQDMLNRIGASWTTSDDAPQLPALDLSRWTTYRLYAGGFEYQAVPLPSQLQNMELRPTPENPLGIFYAAGPLSLGNSVVVQGTLVVNGRLTFDGVNIDVAGFNWRDAAGEPLVSRGNLWPRLPAVVAQDVRFEPTARTLIDGAMIAPEAVLGAGSEFNYVSTTRVSINGTATSRPIGQPHSVVKLAESRDLSDVTGGRKYAVWLEDGASGAWHPIVEVRPQQLELVVVGETSHTQPTPYRIRRNRRRSVDIHGPVSTGSHRLLNPPDWALLTQLQWEERYLTWETYNLADGLLDGAGKLLGGLGGIVNVTDPILFSEWLEDPANFLGWPLSLSELGLGLEPTYHLRNTPAMAQTRHYRWSPPLFEPHTADQTTPSHAGYRWTIVAWNELP